VRVVQDSLNLGFQNFKYSRTHLYLAMALALYSLFLSPEGFAQEHRPCNSESFYVRLGETKFCIPQSYRRLVSLPSSMLGANYEEAKANDVPIPVEFIYFDLNALDERESAPLLPLAGLTISIRTNRQDYYESKKQ
jgi:hypothetical protein